VFGGKNEEMAKEAIQRVYLLGSTTDGEQIVGAAIRRCYSNAPAIELMQKITAQKRRELIEMVQGVGHTSTTEHATFNFAVEGLSRAAAQQLTRHRVASYSMKSQRYYDSSKDEIEVVIPETVKRNPEALEIFMSQANGSEEAYRRLRNLGIRPEDARGILLMNGETALVFSMNARELGDTFFRERLCKRTQGEMRNLAISMAMLVRQDSPNLFRNIGPTCKTSGICWEGEKSCGLYKVIDGGELRVREKHKFRPGIRNDLNFVDE